MTLNGDRRWNLFLPRRQWHLVCYVVVNHLSAGFFSTLEAAKTSARRDTPFPATLSPTTRPPLLLKNSFVSRRYFHTSVHEKWQAFEFKSKAFHRRNDLQPKSLGIWISIPKADTQLDTPSTVRYRLSHYRYKLDSLRLQCGTVHSNYDTTWTITILQSDTITRYHTIPFNPKTIRSNHNTIQNDPLWL